MYISLHYYSQLHVENIVGEIVMQLWVIYIKNAAQFLR
jgi:hypothetical protein